jgi:hypothetical protein
MGVKLGLLRLGTNTDWQGAAEGRRPRTEELRNLCSSSITQYLIYTFEEAESVTWLASKQPLQLMQRPYVTYQQHLQFISKELWSPLPARTKPSIAYVFQILWGLRGQGG